MVTGQVRRTVTGKDQALLLLPPGPIISDQQAHPRGLGSPRFLWVIAQAHAGQTHAGRKHHTCGGQGACIDATANEAHQQRHAGSLALLSMDCWLVLSVRMRWVLWRLGIEALFWQSSRWAVLAHLGFSDTFCMHAYVYDSISRMCSI